MLWIALYFPQLPLEAQRTRPENGAVVIQQGRVIAVDDVGSAAGLIPGMRLSTARGMFPELAVLERETEQEKTVLKTLACFAGNFTPTVCVDDSDALLLEIQASLSLFGGSGKIVEGLCRGCAERGLSVHCGLAPTPQAALWFARGKGFGVSTCCLTHEALPEMLSALPLGVLGGDAKTQLTAFGFKSIGDVLNLSRAGLARRVGVEFVQNLARGLGEIPDPRVPFCFPENFESSIDLPGPASEAGMLIFPAQRLVADFCGWLAARQAGTSSCTLRLIPEQRGKSVQDLDLQLSTPTRDPSRFLRILRERLNRNVLGAPVGRLTLISGDVSPLAGNTSSLLDARVIETPIEVLIERLRARLGDDAVQGIATQPDHRPECASRSAPIGFSQKEFPLNLSRPLCLFDANESHEALPEIHGQPHRRGEALELLAGPERIESGWWDNGETCKKTPSIGDIRRDYFIARTKTREWLWIYRDNTGWYAQGTFA